MTMRSILVAGIVVAVSAVAHAGPDDASPAPSAAVSAESEFERGRALYKEGDYEAAQAAFESAHQTQPNAVFVFNAAQAARKGHACKAAVQHYQEYLKVDPAADNREKVEIWIREMQTCEAVQADGQSRQAVLAKALAEERAQQKTRHKVVTNVGGVWRGAGISATVVGAATIGASIYFTSRSASKRDAIAALCNEGCNWSDRDIVALDADGKSYNRYAIGTAIAGGSLVATGIAMYIWGMTRTETIIVGPSSGGLIVGTAGRF